jgi:pyrroloquinoline quinone biosynthesis protein E
MFPNEETLMQEAKKNNINLTISNKLYTKQSVCPWPWMGVYIDTQKNVVPCCRIGDASVLNMGNLNQSTFSEIWNSKRYQDFRKAHKEGRVPKVCESCYSKEKN